MKKVWSMFMLLAVCLVACTNIDDLEDDVDALKKRVTALETQVRDINSNTEALRELYNEGTFITNIEEKSDSYTLTLSNGKTVNLYMKNDNNLLCPIIGIDSEGYWTVLYNKNETPERLTVNGQPVKANGESGKTPTFNVDSEGYWQVSYDGGKNYSYIYKEGTTDKVSATGDGSAPAEDKNFKSVTVENSCICSKSSDAKLHSKSLMIGIRMVGASSPASTKTSSLFSTVTLLKFLSSVGAEPSPVALTLSLVPSLYI